MKQESNLPPHFISFLPSKAWLADKNSRGSLSCRLLSPKVKKLTSTPTQNLWGGRNGGKALQQFSHASACSKIGRRDLAPSKHPCISLSY